MIPAQSCAILHCGVQRHRSISHPDAIRIEENCLVRAMNGVNIRFVWASMLVVLVTAFAGNRDASAQAGIYAYPRNGQSGEQQQRDKFECHQWAVQQTDFDPITATQSPRHADAQESSGSSSGFLGIGGDRNLIGGEGNVLSDAATGAALGAAGGAIAGDAGLGAAIGAGLSAILGDIVRSDSESEKRQSKPAPPHNQAQLGDYQRAYGVCLSGRDYQVS